MSTSERIAQRRAELEAEHASGLARMQEIKRAEAELAATMHRISGAMQVLDELLNEQPGKAKASE